MGESAKEGKGDRAKGKPLLSAPGVLHRCLLSVDSAFSHSLILSFCILPFFHSLILHSVILPTRSIEE